MMEDVFICLLLTTLRFFLVKDLEENIGDGNLYLKGHFFWSSRCKVDAERDLLRQHSSDFVGRGSVMV